MDIELDSKDWVVESRILNQLEAQDIIGEGKGGGGGHTPIEADDTLSSKQTAKVLLLLGEGEIHAINQVYLNRTPITNFSGASYQYRLGTPSQTVIDGFGEIETLASGFTPLNLLNATPYVRSFDYDVKAVRVTLTLSQLRQVLANGDMVGYSCSFDISIKPTPGGVFSTYKSPSKSGKASSPYSWDVRVDRPAGAVSGQQWTIRVTRSSADDADAKHMSASSITGITELRHPTVPLTYPNSVLLALTLNDAAQFGNRIPEVTIDLDGEMVYLPTNYNPVTRVYTGTWTGAFKTVKEFTDNPFWIIYHILSQRMTGLTAADIDVGQFYIGAQYADVMVDDGLGGTEPRYTCRNSFIQRETPAKFLSYLLSLCNSNFTSNEFGQISLLIDRAGQSITRIVNNTNVVDGTFNYTSNDLETRFSQVNVTFNDLSLLGDTNTTTFTDNTLLDRYGLQTSDVALLGCYSEGMAIRKARWVAWVNGFDTEFISFAKMLEGGTYQVGELVSILDNANSGFDHQGVIVSSSYATGTQTVIADRPLTLTATTYTISYLNDQGTITTGTLQQSDGTFTTLSFNIGTSSPAAVQSPFIIQNDAKQPVTARVIKIKKDGDYYGITCVRHNEAKYAYIDGSLTVTPRPVQYTNLENFTISSPSGVTAEEIYSSNGVIQTKVLHVSWTWTKGTQTITPTYTIMWRRDNQNYDFVTSLQSASYDIVDPTPGQYEIYVYAVNPVSGIRSAPSTTLVYNYRTAAAGSTLVAVTTARIQGTAGLTYQSKDMNLEIVHNTANNDKTDKLKDYIIEIWDAAGSVKKATFTQDYDTSFGCVFTLSYAQNIDIFGSATRTYQVKIYCRDMMGDLSPALAVTVTNPVPATCSFTAVSGTGSTYITITEPSTPDTAGYIVYRSTTSGFTPGVGDIVYKGISNTTTVPGSEGTTYYFKVAAYDSFGETGLNVSSQTANTTLSNSAIEWKITNGLLFKPNDPSTNSISWTAGTIVKNVSGTPTSYSITASNIAWTSGTTYIYFSGSGTTLSTTTTLATAVAAGGWLIGSYHGGTDFKGGTGEAYVDGSTILAGTVGANQLVTGSAVITGTAQLGSAVVTNLNVADATLDYAKISDTIQSTNYNLASHTGWRLHKTGGITAHDITIYDTSGNTVLTAGSQVDFANLMGSTKPENNATVGAHFGNDFTAGPLTLNTTGSAGTMTVVGTPPVVTKTAGVTGFNSHAYSTESYTGSAVVRWKFGSTGCAVGLDASPAGSANIGSVDYYIRNTGSIATCYAEGVLVYTGVTTVLSTDEFEIEYIGSEVRFKQNGITLFVQTGVVTGQILKVDSSFSSVGSTVNSVYFGQYSGRNIVGQITTSNVGTFIGNLAVQTAQIADLAVNTAKIADLAVNTLQIAGNAVTIPSANWNVSGSSASVTMPAQTAPYALIITASASIALTTDNNTVTRNGFAIGRIYEDGVEIYQGTWCRVTKPSGSTIVVNAASGSSASIILNVPGGVSKTISMDVTVTGTGITGAVANACVSCIGAKK